MRAASRAEVFEFLQQLDSQFNAQEVTEATQEKFRSLYAADIAAGAIVWRIPSTGAPRSVIGVLHGEPHRAKANEQHPESAPLTIVVLELDTRPHKWTMTRTGDAVIDDGGIVWLRPKMGPRQSIVRPDD